MGLLTFLLGSCSKQPASVASSSSSEAQAKADVEQLLGSLLPFAQEMLQQHHEFFPFGGHIAMDGTIEHHGAYDGTEHPPSQTLIDILRQAFQRLAHDRNLRACAIIYDIRTIPPGRTEKQDAIAASVDHVSGYSAVIIYPYVFDAEQKLQVETPFAIEGPHEIFGQPQKSAP